MGKIVELEPYGEIPEYAEFIKRESVTFGDDRDWEGHAFAEAIGCKYSDGTIESFFVEDAEQGNTAIFNKLLNDMKLLAKTQSYIDRETVSLASRTVYYIPYKIKNHCSEIPTVTDAYVDRCINVHYSVEFEILLVAGEGFRKYITCEYESEGGFSSVFFDQVEDIENIFEEWFEENSHGFGQNGDGDKFITFYDETGENVDIEICSVGEALSMITSIRVIKCDKKIIKRRGVE